MKAHIVTALDIGTHSIKMVVGRVLETGEVEILGVGEELSSGVRRGAIVNPEETVRRITSLKVRVENMAGYPIEEVVSSVGGSHIFVTPSHGIVAVSRADSSISQEDVDRVLQAAQALSLDSNKQVIEVFPRQFIVDGVGELKEVVGMRGVRLEVDVLAVCAFSPYVKQLTNAVLGAGFALADYIPHSLAASQIVLTPAQKERGVAVLDIGAGTTGLAVFDQGDLIHTAVFPIGSENISNDIAIGLRIEPELAEQIKVGYGALGVTGRKMQKVTLQNGSQITFSQKFLSHIIEARVKEIFKLVNEDLKQISRQGLLPAGVVLAGGGAKLPGITEFTRKELKVTAKIGVPQGMVGPPEDPVFLGALGLLRYGTQFSSSSGRSFGGSDLFDKVKKILKPFIP